MRTTRTSPLNEDVVGLRAMSWLTFSVLLIHVLLLMYGAARAAPTYDETGHLVAGLSHWQYSQFDLYRVNPPLVRLVATFAVWMSDPVMDWSSWSPTATTRQEFRLGELFISLNGKDSIWYFMIARWSCIPFSVLGALMIRRWATELYGGVAGLAAMTLWCFSPSVLGHAALLTPDIPAAATGITSLYCFRGWLGHFRWQQALAAGISTGLAMATKSTWIILLPCFSLFWIAFLSIWRPNARQLTANSADDKSDTVVTAAAGQPTQPAPVGWLSQAMQFGLISVSAFYVLNSVYAFDGAWPRLDRFEFVSHSLSGLDDTDLSSGNRFHGTWLGALRIPLPAQMIQGIDRQKADFEKNQTAYLGGEWKRGGWWYYYLYAMAVKLPTGTLALLGLGICSLFRWWPKGDEWLLLAMMVVLIGLVSINTGINKHLRYAFPAFPFVYVVASRIARSVSGKWVALALVTAASAGSLAVYPYSMSFFNAPSGGPESGSDYLMNSNISWGQDILELIEWQQAHPDADPFYCALHANFDPAALGLEFSVPESALQNSDVPEPGGIPPGWYAVDVNLLYGYPYSIPTPEGRRGAKREFWASFQQRPHVDRIGYSIYIFHVK